MDEDWTSSRYQRNTQRIKTHGWRDFQKYLDQFSIDIQAEIWGWLHKWSCQKLHEPTSLVNLRQAKSSRGEVNMNTPIVEYEGDQLEIDFDRPEFSICPSCASQGVSKFTVAK